MYKRQGFDEGEIHTFYINSAGEHARYPIGGDRAADPDARNAHLGALAGAALVGLLFALAGGLAALWAGAVSYTHLDVYKRQGLEPVFDDAFLEALRGGRTAFLEPLLAQPNGDIMPSAIVVPTGRWGRPGGALVVRPAAGTRLKRGDIACIEDVAERLCSCLLYTSRCV